MWVRMESDHRHLLYKSSALTAELLTRWVQLYQEMRQFSKLELGALAYNLLYHIYVFSVFESGHFFYKLRNARIHCSFFFSNVFSSIKRERQNRLAVYQGSHIAVKSVNVD